MKVKNEYSKKEIKRILNQEIELPEIVDERISDTYSSLGIDTNVTMKYTKKHRTWAAVAIVAILAVGTSVVTIAANKFLSADLVEKDDKVAYDIHVDKSVKEAHEIEVEASYIPEGYEYGEENTPYGGKWHNYDTDGSISIITYNAADLDRLERSGESMFLNYTKDEHIQEIELDGMKANVFVSDGFYTDSDKTVKSIYLFNEEFGYGVQVWNESNLPADEIIKVAEGLKINVLDTVVPYATEEELAKEKASGEGWEKAWEERYKGGVQASSIYKIGEEIKDPMYDANDSEITEFLDDIRFTVQKVEVKDALPADEYPIEHYLDYENEMAAWVNNDGTLKPHERYKYSLDENGMENKEEVLEESIQSKFVVVKMKAKNCGTSQTEWNKSEGVVIAPDLTTLVPRGDGNYSYPTENLRSANEGYSLQWTSNNSSSFPVYFDKIYFTDGIKRMKDALWRPLAAGEELEYTLVYVVDEDQLDNMYLWFFSGEGGINGNGETIQTPYVKISE